MNESVTKERFSLSAAKKFIRTEYGANVNESTIRRWIAYGSGGHKLGAFKFGRRVLTDTASIRAFFAALNGSSDQVAVATKSTGVSAEVAGAALAASGC